MIGDVGITGITEATRGSAGSVHALGRQWASGMEQIYPRLDWSLKMRARRRHLGGLARRPRAHVPVNHTGDVSSIFDIAVRDQARLSQDRPIFHQGQLEGAAPDQLLSRCHGGDVIVVSPDWRPHGVPPEAILSRLRQVQADTQS